MLQNTSLIWDRKLFEIVEGVTVEQPAGWTYVRDPQVKPAYSLHKDDGMQIGGGWRSMRAGYQQQVRLEGNQRYLLKAIFTPEVYLGPDQQYEAGSVYASFMVNDQRGGVSALAPAGNLKKQTTLFVVEPTRSGTFNISFWLASKWALQEVKMTVHSIEVMAVSNTYGIPVRVNPTSPAPSVPAPEIEILKLMSANYTRTATLAETFIQVFIGEMRAEAERINNLVKIMEGSK